MIDDNNEQFTGAQAFPNWSSFIENDVIIFNGRTNEYNASEPLDDYGEDGIWAQGSIFPEPFIDCGLDGICYPDIMEHYQDEGEGNGVYDGDWELLDCGIDGNCEFMLDQNGNPILDDSNEQIENPDWSNADVGEGDGMWNPAMDEGEYNGIWDEGEIFIDSNGDGLWTTGDTNPWYIPGNTDIDNQHLRGRHYYDEESVSLLFDVFNYDLGEDG